jgi:hypothetical protein
VILPAERELAAVLVKLVALIWFVAEVQVHPLPAATAQEPEE